MTRRATNGLLARLSLFILVGSVLSGCATFRSDLTWQRLGVRPDEPKLEISTSAEQKAEKDKKDKDAGGANCAEYVEYVTYSQRLMEAYHSRATHNRGWVYIAGITGLGVAAASGGLAAATAVGAGTLALLSISGGFAAGTFATISNQDLAMTYTIAANGVDKALKESEQMRLAATNNCTGALTNLKAGVSKARTDLEESRTNNAVGAIRRAKAAQESLNSLIKEVEASRITAVPDALSFDPAKAVELAVTLKGGKAEYTIARKPKDVDVTPFGQTTDTFKITTKANSSEAGDIVFLDSSHPPLTIAVPIKKKAP